MNASKKDVMFALQWTQTKIPCIRGRLQTSKHSRNVFDEDYYEDNPLPTAYLSGTKNIDHMFCTPRLFDCIVGVSIEPLAAGIKTDHHALIVDFDTEAMLGGSIQQITKNSTRILKSSSKKPPGTIGTNWTTVLPNRTFTIE
jgi:hypothetical protein